MRRRYVVGQGASDLKQIARPNRRLINPGTGTDVFATFPALISQHRDFVGGPIHLKEGSHSGPNNGFGFTHIWKEHFPDEDHGAAEARVIALVASVLVAGSSIYYEVASSARADRAVVVNHSEGRVIVGETIVAKGVATYSVITAFPNPNARGTKIGTL